MKALQITFRRLLQQKRIEWICPCCGETIETDSDLLVNKQGFNLKLDCPACYAGMIPNKILEGKQ